MPSPLFPSCLPSCPSSISLTGSSYFHPLNRGAPHWSTGPVSPHSLLPAPRAFPQHTGSERPPVVSLQLQMSSSRGLLNRFSGNIP